MDPVLLYTLILLITPLVTWVLLQVLSGVGIRKGGSLVMTSLIAALGLSAGFFASNFMGYSGSLLQIATRWVDAGPLEISVGIYLDQLAIALLFLFSLMAIGIQLYIGDQARKIPNYPRYLQNFCAYWLLAYAALMTDNLLILFGVWQLLGVITFLILTSSDPQAHPARSGGTILATYLVADGFLLVAVLLIFSRTGSFNIAHLLALVNNGWFADDPGVLFGFGILCLVGLVSKLVLFLWIARPGEDVDDLIPVRLLVQFLGPVLITAYLLLRLDSFFPLGVHRLGFLIGMFLALVAIIYAAISPHTLRNGLFITVSQMGLLWMLWGSAARATLYLFLWIYVFSVGGMWLSLDAARQAGLKKSTLLGSFSPPVVKIHPDRQSRILITLLLSLLSLAGIPLTSGHLVFCTAISEWSFNQAATIGLFLKLTLALILCITAYSGTRLLIRIIAEPDSILPESDHPGILSSGRKLVLRCCSAAALFIFLTLPYNLLPLSLSGWIWDFPPYSDLISTGMRGSVSAQAGWIALPALVGCLIGLRRTRRDTDLWRLYPRLRILMGDGTIRRAIFQRLITEPLFWYAQIINHIENQLQLGLTVLSDNSVRAHSNGAEVTSSVLTQKLQPWIRIFLNEIAHWQRGGPRRIIITVGLTCFAYWLLLISLR